MCLSCVGAFKVRQHMYLYGSIATSHTTSSWLVSLAPLHPLVYEQSAGFTEDPIWKRSHWCICYQAAPCVRRCGIWKKKKKRNKWARVLKKKKMWEAGSGVGWGGQSSDKSAPAYRVPAKCLCLLPGVGSEIRPVREWGGWLNDFTSPFQLQQLPIYIVMQIHGLSQMVLFQHRGCIEIWLFIPSTPKVFNAPSSVCFYPFFSSPGSALKSVQSDVSLPNGNGGKEGMMNFGEIWQGSNRKITEKQERKKQSA